MHRSIPSHPIPSVNKIFSKFQKGPFQLRILKVLTPLLEHNRLERMSNEPFRVCFRRLPSGDKTIAARTCHQPWTVTSRGPVFAAFFLKIKTKSTKTRGKPVHAANFSSKFYIGWSIIFLNYHRAGFQLRQVCCWSAPGRLPLIRSSPRWFNSPLIRWSPRWFISPLIRWSLTIFLFRLFLLIRWSLWLFFFLRHFLLIRWSARWFFSPTSPLIGWSPRWFISQLIRRSKYGFENHLLIRWSKYCFFGDFYRWSLRRFVSRKLVITETLPSSLSEMLHPPGLNLVPN